jgi:hypothetical protein
MILLRAGGGGTPEPSAAVKNPGVGVEKLRGREASSGYGVRWLSYDTLFGDSTWRTVTVKARWLDRHGREVVQVEGSIGGEMYGESYLADPERLREA